MMKLLKYILSFTCNYLSYLAFFLAGVSLIVPAKFFLAILIGAFLLGACGSYYRHCVNQQYKEKEAD